MSARFAVALVLSVHVGLLAWSATRHSPTFNEIGHVPAGLSHWQYRMFHLYRVNPPLPRMVATLPLLVVPPKTDWSNYGLNDFSREEIPMGIRFARANGAETFRIFAICRWACIPFSLVGALVCYRWGAELWGSRSGLVALTLWAFNPMILGHAPLVMPDVPAAAMGLAASYAFWNWLREPAWGRSLAAGGLLGVALLCKTTLLVFLAIWPILWLIAACCGTTGERAASQRQRMREILMLVTACLIALYVVNVGYAFTGSLQPLKSFRFQSRMLGGDPKKNPPDVGNRWANGWIGRLPVPVPRDYLLGIDQQRTDFEMGDRCYLRGEWQQGGWWYFYLYAWAVKTPVGTLVLLGIGCVLVARAVASQGCAFWPVRAEGVHAAAASFDRRTTESRLRPWMNELCLLFPAIVIFGLVSSQTSYTNHFRYVLPAFPFAFVWLGRAGQAVSSKRSIFSAAVVILVAWSTVSSLAAYPHSISYFHELAGGSRNGPAHLLDSNIAWGQDLLFLRDWLTQHPEVEEVGLASIGWIDPGTAGIAFTIPPVGPYHARESGAGTETDSAGPQPGWYVIDANFLRGTHWPTAAGSGLWQKIPAHGEGPNFEYFRQFEPVALVGGSLFVYHVGPEDVKRVREALELVPVPRPAD